MFIYLKIMNYSGWELKFFDSSNNYRQYQFSLIKKYIGKKLLEIGPGTGEFANKYFIDCVENIYLSEIHDDFNKILRDKFKKIDNVEILSQKVRDINDEFDTICYFDVLEHIESHEDELTSSLKRLKNGGSLIIIVPAFNYLFSHYDELVGHYRRYEKSFFYNFVKKHNLKCEKLIYFDSIGYLFLLINKLIKTKTKKSVGVATIFWNLLVPLSRLIDKITFNSFGKSVLCVIKK